MKKLLFTLLIMLPLMAIAKKHKDTRLIVEAPVFSETASFEVDSIRFSFEWKSYSDIGVKVTIDNNTTSRIYVEWNNTRLRDEPICFGDDNSFTYRDSKPDEVIHRGSYARRFIARQSQFENESKRLFNWETFEEFGSSAVCKLIIPIKRDNKVTDYLIELRVVAVDK